jgi:hypothetical protein
VQTLDFFWTLPLNSKPGMRHVYHIILSIHCKNSRIIRSRFCLHIQSKDICWGQTANPLRRWNRRRFSTLPSKMIV